MRIRWLIVPLYAATLAGEWSLVRSRHYPSDIFGGAAISVVVALVASKVWPAHRSDDSVTAGPPAGESGS